MILPDHEARLILARLRRQFGADAGGTVMVVSARSGEGVSTLSASLALRAGEEARRPVWLLDLEFGANRMFERFSSGELARRLGPLGPPYSASLRTEPPFRLSPEPSHPPAGAFTAHRVGDTRVMVTRFDHGVLEPGVVVRVAPRPAYWEAVRAATDFTVVDAPALETSDASLVVARDVDACLIVVQADRTDARMVKLAASRLREAGGRVVGAVLNRRREDAAGIDRLAFTC